MRRALLVPAVLLALLSGACSSPTDRPATLGLSSADRTASAAPAALPSYDHVVVVVFENHSYSQIKEGAPYFVRLADHGAEMTRSHAVTHPSEPNYLALFGGSTFDVGSDACPLSLHGGHLARQLRRTGHSFRAYSEGLPSAGYTGCTSGRYARKHAPWVNFSSFRQGTHRPYSSFPSDYSSLPDVAFVIPDLCSDMHDCSVRHGNRWLKSHFKDYVAWAREHDSLLLVTFDEDDDGPTNHIYTALAGAHVQTGNYAQRINHYNVLHTIEALFGLPALRNAADAPPIRGIWN